MTRLIDREGAAAIAIAKCGQASNQIKGIKRENRSKTGGYADKIVCIYGHASSIKDSLPFAEAIGIGATTTGQGSFIV